LQAEVGTCAASGAGAVRVIGINAIGLRDSASVAAMCDNVTIPLLQDADSVRIWVAAAASKDDVYILDSHRNVVRKFNAQQYQLQLSANADSLRTWVRRAMGSVATAHPSADGRSRPAVVVP